MKPVVYIEKSDIGATLSCWLYCTMWMLYAAEMKGLTGFVWWPPLNDRCILPHFDTVQFGKCMNMYDWWFEQPFYKGDGLPDRSETWLWENCPQCGEHCLMGQGLPFVKDWYQKHLIFRPEIHAKVDALAVKYGVDFNNTIGTSWRGCESAFDPWRVHAKETIECYFPEIDKLLANEPTLRIFANSEEVGVAEKLVEHYPNNAFMIPEFFRAPSGYKGVLGAPNQSGWINPASGYERGVETCMQMLFLSKCKHYIKNKSNMSYIAGYLSRGNVVNINCEPIHT